MKHAITGFTRTIAAIAAATLVIAACGGGSSSTSSNRQRNAALDCYVDDAAKAAAVLLAQDAFDALASTPAEMTMSAARIAAIAARDAARDAVTAANNSYLAARDATMPFNDAFMETQAAQLAALTAWIAADDAGRVALRPGLDAARAAHEAASAASKPTEDARRAANLNLVSARAALAARDAELDALIVAEDALITTDSVALTPAQQDAQSALTAAENQPLCEVDAASTDEATPDAAVSAERSCEITLTVGVDYIGQSDCEEVSVQIVDTRSTNAIEWIAVVDSVTVARGTWSVVAESTKVVTFTYVPAASTVEITPAAAATVATDCEINIRYRADIHYVTISACDVVSRIDSDSGSSPSSSSSWFVNGEPNFDYVIYFGEQVVAQGHFSGNPANQTIIGVYQAAAPAATVPTETTVPTDTTVPTMTCTAYVTSDGASFSCLHFLFVTLFYHTNAGGDEHPIWLYGDQSTVFGPLDDVRDIWLAISGGVQIVFNRGTGPGNYEFQVPIVDPVVVDNAGPGMGEPPWWDGSYSPTDTPTFTISVVDGAPVYVELFAACDAQEISASITIDGADIPFEVMPDYVLNNGLCGVSIYLEDGLAAGDYVVTVSASSDSRISYGASVDSISLQMTERSDTVNEDSPSDVTYTLMTQQINAPQTFTLQVPAGGLWFTARGNSNQPCSGSVIVDPYLILLDSEGVVVARNDDGGEDEDSNCLASFLNLRLDEGTYRLVATTWDLVDPEEGNPDAPTEYELVYGLETSETITSPADLAEAVTPSAETPTIVLPSTEYKLPVESIVVEGTSQTNSGVPVIPIGVTSMLCTGDCITTLFENAGIDAFSIEISAGGKSVVVTRASKKVRIPVARGATSITAVAKSADGATIAKLSSPVHQQSVKDLVMMRGAKDTTKPSASTLMNSQNNLPYVLAGLLLISILAVINARRKKTVTQA